MTLIDSAPDEPCVCGTEFPHDCRACPITREPHRWAPTFHKAPMPSPRDECQNCGEPR